MTEEESETLSDYGDIDAEQENELLKSDNEKTSEVVSDTDDDDEEDMDEEEKLMKQYLETLDLIDRNKYDYDSYLRLLDIAHKLSDLDKIRQGCDLFSSVYPLAPDIWLPWLKIEESLACSPEEILNVENLFRRALIDYFSVDIALEFAKITLKSPNFDSIWDELLSVYALHCTKGRQLYVLWRNYFEMRDIPIDKKKETLVEVFQKELSIPLYDMEESYIEFKVFCEKNKDISINWEKLDKRYNRAKEHLKRILPFEQQLAKLDPKNHQERVSIYNNYILEADKFMDDDMVQILYERMVADCCLNSACWLSYINYLDRQEQYLDDDELPKYFVFQQTTIDIINRSLKNCPWSEKLYIKKMRLYEKQKQSRQEIQKVLESGLEADFQQPEAAVALWLEYLSYLRRHINFEDEKEVEIIRGNFNLAWNALGRQWGVLADCDCEILQFWGRLEYGPLNNPSKGKDLWTTVMESSDNASKSGLWIEFAHLELRQDVDGARRIFRKALSITTLDNPSVIASAWLRFERCNGTLNTTINCQELCEKILNQIKNKSIKKNKFKTESKGKGVKRKNEESWTNRENTSAGTSSRPTNNTPLSSVHPERKETIHKGTTAQNVMKKPKLDESRPHKVIKEHENEEIDTTKDHLRIFLSNLDYNVSEEEIRDSLSEIQISDVNLIRASNGRGRGFAYIELISEEDVKKALSLDGKILKGRPLYISSVLRDKQKRQKFKYSESSEPNKLFVKGVPHDTTKEELEMLFSPFGRLRDVRIVYHKSGKPKGIAYIEYEEESAASAAVKHQFELKDFKLNVAISAPPPKLAVKEELNLHKFLGLGGDGGGRKRGVKREQKPRISLIPTIVRKNALSSGLNSSSPEINNHLPEKKTNDDFRKMLNK